MESCLIGTHIVSSYIYISPYFLLDALQMISQVDINMIETLLNDNNYDILKEKSEI